MEIEDAFGITISDAEAQGCLTVGQMFELVQAKLASREEGCCLTASAFYRSAIAHLRRPRHGATTGNPSGEAR